jgi:hypothetical protein
MVKRDTNVSFLHGLDWIGLVWFRTAFVFFFSFRLSFPLEIDWEMIQRALRVLQFIKSFYLELLSKIGVN